MTGESYNACLMKVVQALKADDQTRYSEYTSDVAEHILPYFNTLNTLDGHTIKRIRVVYKYDEVAYRIHAPTPVVEALLNGDDIIEASKARSSSSRP